MIKKVLKIALYGFISWIIPFIASIFFFSKEGLVIDKFLFKSIMILVGSISATFLLISYFKSVRSNFLREGIIVGISWYAINILFDLLVLIPMSKMSIADYCMQIALVYSVIIAMSITVGASLQIKRNN
jgi:hypothetical protein